MGEIKVRTMVMFSQVTPEMLETGGSAVQEFVEMGARDVADRVACDVLLGTIEETGRQGLVWGFDAEGNRTLIPQFYDPAREPEMYALHHRFKVVPRG